MTFDHSLVPGDHAQSFDEDSYVKYKSFYLPLNYYDPMEQCDPQDTQLASTVLEKNGVVKAATPKKEILSVTYNSQHYILNHRIWKPIADVLSFQKLIDGLTMVMDNSSYKTPLEGPDGSKKAPGNQKKLIDSTPTENLDSFISFTYCPTVYGKECIPPLMFHTSVSIDDRIYVFGGLRLTNSNNYDLPDLSHIRVKGGPYPFPLKDELLNNPSMVPNNVLYLWNTETNIIQIPQLEGPVPPALCSMTATTLTHRYIFLYGGFELVTKKVLEKDGITYLERDIQVSSKAWVFDTVLFTFQEITLVDDSDTVPINFERFGHSTTSLGIKEVKFDSIEEVELSDTRRLLMIPLFVFGGIAKNFLGHKWFVLSYNWKIELRIEEIAAKEYLKFSLVASADHLTGKNSGPQHRAYHAAILCDNAAFLPSITEVNNPPISMDSVPAAPPPEIKPSQIDPNLPFWMNNLQSKSIIIHGGSNLNSIFGDLWKYSFHTQIWEKLSTFTHKFNDVCVPLDVLYQVQYQRACHLIIVLDKYLLFSGGFGEEQMSHELEKKTKAFGQAQNYQSDKLPDAAKIAEQLSENMKRRYLRLVMLDLSTKTWVFTKCYHRLSTYINYQKFIDDPFVDKYIRDSLEKNFEEELTKLIYSGKLTPEMTRKIYFVIRSNRITATHLNLLGSSTCFSNGKVCTIGGLLLCNKLDVDTVARYNRDSPILEFLLRGYPIGSIINLELPIYAQGYSNPFNADNKIF